MFSSSSLQKGARVRPPIIFCLGGWQHFFILQCYFQHHTWCLSNLQHLFFKNQPMDKNLCIYSLDMTRYRSIKTTAGRMQDILLATFIYQNIEMNVVIYFLISYDNFYIKWEIVLYFWVDAALNLHLEKWLGW